MLPAGDDTCASPNASIVVNFRHAGALPGDRLGIWYGKNDQIAIDPILRIEDRSRMRLRQVIPPSRVAISPPATKPFVTGVAQWRLLGG